jgi:hypothetical protein
MLAVRLQMLAMEYMPSCNMPATVRSVRQFSSCYGRTDNFGEDVFCDVTMSTGNIPEDMNF